MSGEYEMLSKIKSKFEIKEILKFLVGGGSAVIVDFLVYTLLKRSIDVSLSKAISYIAGALLGFIINKLWTFESKKFKVSEIVKYALLYAFSAGANTAVNGVVLKIISSNGYAFLCATGVSTVINFLGQKFLVFRKDEEE